MKKTGRRAFLTLVLMALAAGSLSAGGIAFGAVAPSVLDSDSLKMELRVTTDAQAAYVDDVVEKVKKGAIPTQILTSAYRYAMRQEKSRRPIYFRICVEQLCKKAGIKVPFLSF